ncbi:MAG: right-handed parallel beta-helix repeat-containing protein, partial [Phycisphaerales bacterium]
GARGQTTWYVDDDASSGGDGTSWATAYDSLSTALTAAQSGDQVWVAAGTYVGNFTLALGVEVYGGFAGNETELTQRDWNANPTILNGNGTGSVVISPAGATETTRIDGFTITNGRAFDGGGLYLRDSSATIANNRIKGNSATYRGGGLYLDYSSPTIANNTITGNSATGSGGSGGGLYLSSSSPTIANNTIIGNSTILMGGGLYLYDSFPEIANNTITANSATGGGGLSLRDSSPTIANNVIAGNGANDGGGLHLWDSSPMMANNTITGNGAREGGGLYLYRDSSPTIANTIIAFNSSGIHLFRTTDTPTLRHDCVYSNTAYDFDGLPDPTGTDGNISADPLLADPRYGNTHIQPGSPCVDTGDNTDALGNFDIDGEPRVQGGTVDIGADESDGTVWLAGPYIIVRVSPAGEDANDGSSWGLAKRTVQAGIDAASVLGGEVWVQASTYYERLTLHPYAYVYGGFAAGETARDERDWDANVTILDGQQQGSVVTARAGCEGVGAIDGFTITNGNAPYGGGLRLYNSSPTIANNTVMGNKAFYSGGGLSVGYSSSTITNNTITSNSARVGYGGGLALSSFSPTIANNEIRGNNAIYGGGLFLEQCSPTVANNEITSNSAGYGGGLFLVRCSPTMANNAITGNSASAGGALYMDRASPTMANTIVAFNSSGVHRSGTSSPPTLRYNCVYGNTAYDYSGLLDPTGTDGNISADPLFAQSPDPGPDGVWGTHDDDLGDLQLLSGSPCIDAGDNDGVPPDTPDLDGDSDTEEPLPFDLAGGPRFLDDPQTPDTGNGVPPIVDMGAYEFHPPIVMAAHLDIKPGSCPNPVNLGSRGVVPVAIVGSESFDVTELIFHSLALGRADGVGGVVPPLTKRGRPWGAIEDVAMHYLGDLCDCQEGGPDGIEDFTIKFSTREMVRALELDTIPRRTSVALTLTGSLVDGTTFEAFDCIVTTGQPTQRLHGSRLGKKRDDP